MESRIVVLCLCLGLCLGAAVSNAQLKPDGPDKDPACEVEEWTEWSPCRLHRTYRHDVTLSDVAKQIPDGIHPPSFSPRGKRDLSYTSHVSAGRSRRSKRQAQDSGQPVSVASPQMEKTKQIKTSHWKHLDECREDGSCPEKNRRPSGGPQQCVNGTAGPFACWNIDMISMISIEDLGYKHPMLNDNRVNANDMWGWTDPWNGDEYVLVGLSGGTAFVRITNPEKPQVLGLLYSSTKPSLWRDMKVIGNTAYIVAEAADHGMQVFDLTQLRNMTDFHVMSETALYSKFGSAHNIVANADKKYLYVVGARNATFVKQDDGTFKKILKYPDTACLGGLHIIDVEEPLKPVFVGCFDDDGYTHDAQCVVYNGPDTKYQGKPICFNCNEDTLTIVNLNDHRRPELISRSEYRGSMYTHQGWLTEDHTVLLLDDELDELSNVYDGRTKTHIWDVTSLEKPIFRSTYVSAIRSIDHNQYVRGNYTYQSNYKSGLQVLYINQHQFDLKPVAYFDVEPSGDGDQFEGTWSNYPYFKSGVVAMTSINHGLFLLKPDYEAMAEESNTNGGMRKEMQGDRWRYRGVKIADPSAICPGMEQRQECELDRMDDTGKYFD